jgi:hypothetical protein
VADMTFAAEELPSAANADTAYSGIERDRSAASETDLTPKTRVAIEKGERKGVRVTNLDGFLKFFFRHAQQALQSGPSRPSENALRWLPLLAFFSGGCMAGGGGHAGSNAESPDRSIPLFDGETLRGWRKVGGEATFHVDDGCIVGTVGPGLNTFLLTEAVFADFELTLEVRLDVPGNSGIQFRSHQRPDAVVYGYQCEIDPSPRAWSGGIYDESRRGWLATLDGKPDAQAAFRVDAWNLYVIRANGPHLQTWVNGVPCADLIDGADAEGFIALQVHSGDRGRIRWRDIRIRILNEGDQE